MGALNYFQLDKYIEKFGLDGFLETGFGHGTGVALAAQSKFDKLFSVEISRQVVDNCENGIVNDPRVKILIGLSTAGLKYVFNNYGDSKYLIFLDAHFPAADLGLAGFNDEKNLEIRYPLLSELAVIKEMRANSTDVIIIDDLMFYSNEIFPDSHLKKHFNIEPPQDNNCLDKIMNFFSETHDAELIREFSGYGVFTPKIKNN